MEGRVDLSALERSRMLGSLSTGTLASLRGSSSFSDTEPMSQHAADSERSRAGSPSGLSQYSGHFLPPSSLHPSGSSYAMMAGYLASGHVPDSLKHLLPEMQYWSAAAQSEGYTRYLLGNMYYPYLPYMPATESLALFAHNSASAAQIEALQAQAVQHRIYDLQKEALGGQGIHPHNIYPYSHLYPPPTAQVEATNLSLPSSSKSKQGEKNKSEDQRGGDDKREHETRGRLDDDRRESKISEQGLDFSKHNEGTSDRRRGKLSKTDDIDKIKSTSKMLKSPSTETGKSLFEKKSVPCRSDVSRKNDSDADLRFKAISPDPDRKRHVSGGSLKREKHSSGKYDQSSHVRTALHSPQQRHKALSNPDRTSRAARTPDRKEYVRSPCESNREKIKVTEQEVPENLCIKDKHRENRIDIESKGSNKTDSVSVQTPDTSPSPNITVSSTLTVITSDIGLKDKSSREKASSVSPPSSQNSPSLSQSGTTTTYSLPYYHNLFSRVQPSDVKKVHATTYVPEVGTISSPVAGAPAVIQVKESKNESDNDGKRDKTKDRTGNVDVTSNTHIESTAEDENCDVVEIEQDNEEVLNKVSAKETAKGSTDSKIKFEKSDSPDNSLMCVQKENYDKKGEKSSESRKGALLEGAEKRKCKTMGNKKDSKEVSVISKSDLAHSSQCNKGDKPSVSETGPIKNNNKIKAKSVSGVQSSVNRDLKSCDLNHNSTESDLTGSKVKSTKPVPLTVLDISDVITVSDTEEKDIEKNADIPKKTCDVDDISKLKLFSSSKQTTVVKPIPISKSLTESDGNCTKSNISSQESVRNKLSESKHSDGIPIGIAVARQRSIAPKLPSEKEPMRKGCEDTKLKNPVADVKPIRPIRPSTKGTSNSSKGEKRNELPANLIVTGGTTPSGVFWPEDPASRQLAAQFLQGTHPLAPTSWYGQSPFPIPPAITTSTTIANAGSQLPLTVPAGYKLAQDSLTGQILILPSGADVFDSSRMFGGIPLGPSVNTGSTFGAATIVAPGQSGTPSTIVTQTPLFPGQTVLTERPENMDMGIQPYMPIFRSSILSTTDVSAAKDEHHTATVSTNIITAPGLLRPIHDATSVAVNGDNSETHTIIGSLPSVIGADGIVGDISSFAFSSQTAPVIFNPTIIPAQNITDQSVHDEHHLKQEPATVQSRGTSPMLPPAPDSCTEDAVESKSDDNSDEIIDICEIDVKTNIDPTEHDIEKPKETTIGIKDNVCEIIISDMDAANNVNNTSTSFNDECLTVSNDSEVGGNKDTITFEKTDSKINIKIDEHTFTSETTPFKAQPKTNRNIFNELSAEYDPFMDPQVLQAADGLELLSALAEKSAHSALVISSKTPETDETPNIVKSELSIKDKTEVEKTMSVLKTVDKIRQNDDKIVSVLEKKKSRVKCGYPLKAKQEVKAQVVEEKKMTTFCGITVPEDDDVIDSIEMEMKMRLAELQKRYKEKQKQLAKLTPKKPKDSEKDKDTEKQKSISDVQRGPGRPKKRPRDSNSNDNDASSKNPKVKKHDLTSQKTPTNGSPSGSNSNHHGHPTKRKKMAEMLVDRVFRKTGSSFKIPLSKKVNLIAPARIEFPGPTTVSERSEHARHKKSLDFKKLIKRSRLSQINGKESAFVGGFWNKKYSERKHHFHHDVKMKKRKKDKVVDESGLGLLAEYATKSRDDINKKKRKSEEVSMSLSPDSPNKKRKPGRPKKCDVVHPGVTETIVAKQSKHMDFFRWQAEEPMQERTISLEGKTPLKPLYLDEWNVRRSERIFLSDPSPQTSPNPISPGAVKPKTDSPGSKVKLASPSAQSKTESAKPDTKQKMEKMKKSQSLNMSMKVKKKYSTSFNQQQRAREKTTELLKATRDRLTQSRLEKKEKQMRATPKTVVNDDSDTDDIPLSRFKVHPKTSDPPSCVLQQDKLTDGMRILVFMDGLFHEGELKAIRPPDIYGAVLDNERKTRPHYYSLEEILKEAIKDTQPEKRDQLKEGTRICAYWSQQYSCLYPGTISKGSPNPSIVDKDLFNVEFDDGDTGKIPLDHIRIIPQDFPHVEYDPNPLLLLTARRRTMSMSESGEPRKSQSEPPKKTQSDQLKKPQSDQPKKSQSDQPKKSQSDPLKEFKVKRGPGRPPKADRLISVESVGDEDVFVNETKAETGNKTKAEYKQGGGHEKQNETGTVFIHPRDIWQWSGSCTKRPGMKGKARKEFYKTIYRQREHISVGDCAVFISTGRQSLPYVGRIESFWEAWSGQMVVKVKWFYHPEETKGGKRLQNMKGALFRSDHEDENDVQTISHKCEVIPYSEYRRRVDVISHENNIDVYYLAGSYEPTVGHIKFEPGVL